MTAGDLVISNIQDVIVVDFRNKAILDGNTVSSIASQLYALVDQRAHRKIVLDFTDVKFLSSSMLGVLIVLLKKVKTIKGRFIICGLRPSLHKVFRITRLDKVLEFADSEQEALGRMEAFIDG